MVDRSSALGRRALERLAVGALAFAASGAGTITPARAQDAIDVVVTLPACGPRGFGGLMLRRLLILELTEAGVASLEIRARGEDAPAARVSLSLDAPCDDDREVTLEVRGGPTAASVTQRLDLHELEPSARARAIAVASSEQVRLQRILSERAVRPTPGIPDDPPPPTPPPRVASDVAARVPPDTEPVERPPGLEPAETPGAPGPVPIAGSIGVAFEARGFPELATWPVGARVGAALVLFELVRLGFDLGPSFAAVEHPLGRIELWLVTVGASAALTWRIESLAAIFAGVRVDVGYASFSARNGRPPASHGEGASVILAGTVGLDVRLGSRVSWRTELDVGGALSAQVALAGTERALGTSGPMFGLRSGFALELE
ncbi:MAG: hypothetical protein AB7S26_27895 [Sandaracinaceae bacterium]